MSRKTPPARLRLEILGDRCLPSTYVVSPTGSDGAAGTADQPFATVQHALDRATRPGDVVQVRAGTYHEQVAFRAGGTAAGGFITLAAYPGEHPVLDGTGLSGNSMVSLANVSFVKLVGFEIAHFTGAPDGSAVRVAGAGTNIELRENTVHDVHGTGVSAIGVHGTTARLLANLVIDGNEVYDAGPGVVLDGNLYAFRITNNRVHGVAGNGIAVVADPRVNLGWWPRNGVLRGNTVYGAHAGGSAAGIAVDGARVLVLEANTVHHNDRGIDVGASRAGSVANYLSVRDNLIVQNDWAGLAFGGTAAAAGRVLASTFVNNTLYQNDASGSGAGQLLVRYGSGNVVANNLVWASADGVLSTVWLGGVANALRTNLYYTAGPTAHFYWNLSDFHTLADYRAWTRIEELGSVMADPRLADPAAGDFHLLADSPVINAGSAVAGWAAPVDFDGVPRPQYGRWDMGAFEYVAPAAGFTADQKRRAEQLTSLFENSTTVIQYGYIEALGDGRGYTAGRAGFTTATGDLLDVVERYTTRVPGNGLAPFLPRLRQLAAAGSDSVDGLGGLPAAWQAAADDPVFRAVQDQVVDDTYYKPALAHWKQLGLRTALSLAALYDAVIQHGDGPDPDGLPALLRRATALAGGTPAGGVDDRRWLDAFLRARRSDLAYAYDPDTRTVWAESVSRVDVFVQLAARGNYNLTGPFTINTPDYPNITIA